MERFNTKFLDKRCTYVGIEVGTTRIARIIQRVGLRKYRKMPAKQIASYILALRNKKGVWYVWEGHFAWGGIKEYPLKEYFEINEKNEKKEKKLHLYSYPLSRYAMDYWLANNPGYSATNLFLIAGERIAGLKLPDTKGVVCSGAIAHCDYRVCNEMGLQIDDIMPVDYQMYFNRYRKIK